MSLTPEEIRLPVPYRPQETSASCGAACLRMVLEYYSAAVTEEALRQRSQTTWQRGTTARNLAQAARDLGYAAEVVENVSFDQLREFLQQGMPLIALVDPTVLYGISFGEGHFIVVVGMGENSVVFHDPQMKAALTSSRDDFFHAWAASWFEGVKIWKATSEP